MELWAYFLENKSSTYNIDNRPLFCLIRDAALCDDSVFVDDIRDLKRPELAKLFGAVAAGDTVMVRSLTDLADTPTTLLSILQEFDDKGVDVASVNEPWYTYKAHFEQIASTMGIVAEWSEKKRRLGIERAKDAGRMGRKPDDSKKEQIQKLRSAGLTVNEITKLVGMSRSTYYRHKRKEETL